MKKYYIVIAIALPLILLLTYVLSNRLMPNKEPIDSSDKDVAPIVVENEPVANMPNPASVHCEKNGGKLEIVTSNDGSQFGLCIFDDYSCDEWLYFNGNCTVEDDAEKIKSALIAKGLDLTDMKVVIKKHLGKYISGSVVPISSLGGGGYVFAVKEDEEITVLADGNGVIMCSAFDDYPDFPSYLVPECIDVAGNSMQR